MTIDFQKVAEATEKAPEEIKKLMFSPELGEKLLEIVTINGIEEEEPYLQIVDEVVYVMLGLKEGSSFIDSLVQIGINKDSAITISNGINQELFSKLDNIRKGEEYKPTPTTLDYSENQSGKGATTNDESELLIKRVFGMIRDKSRENPPEEIANLPETKQNFILGGAWKERVEEIAKKYSLSQVQTDLLTNNVLFVLMDISNKDDLMKTITTTLNISHLLAEQIVEDLEARVFERVTKNTEDKEKKVEEIQKPEVVVSNPVQNLSEKIEKDIPEVRPETLPMIEKGEEAHDTAPPIKTETKPVAEVKPPEGAKEQVLVTQTAPAIPPPPAQNTSQPANPPQPVPPPPKEYVVDPYREPLE